VFLGGPTRTRVILVLACVLALSSADAATVGAAAIYLRKSLNIGNTDIGLLVAVSAVVGAIASLPFGMLADRVRRTWTLGFAIVLWGTAMIWSAAAGSFGDLLLSRLGLGVVTAAAGPAVASLVGDYFPGGERGKIYSYILTGELVGAGIGFTITGDVAALSWRASFVILALAAFPLAWAVFKLPEPQRGGVRPLTSEKTGGGGATSTMNTTNSTNQDPSSNADPESYRDGAESPMQSGVAPQDPPGPPTPPGPQITDAQRLAIERGLTPDRDLVMRARRPRMGMISATRYVLAVRTNVALIISSACGYYFLSGVQTFGVEFVRGQYRVNQALANLLMLVIGGGAAIGIMVAGPGGDSLLRKGRLQGRILIAAVAASLTVLLFIPALLTTSIVTALPYLVFAAAALSAQNPPIDAARLDIMPASLWGRAEGIRTFLRTMAQALAPLLFGVFSDHVFGGGTSGLKWTLVVMLLPLSASAVYLFRAMRTYPTDVATAGAVSAVDPPPEP
jgi:MFS family permease